MEQEVELRTIVSRRGIYYFIKRMVDIAGSIVGLFLLAPLFCVVALVIFIEDGTPVFFSQDRNGLHGKVFRMYKFRSMCKNAPELHKAMLEQNELDGPAFKIKEDPRITRVGRFIRRTSIDELPQLLNILKGEMSFVGPRPLPTYETALCSEYQKQRLYVKPGLTCYWQCSGRSDMPFDEWMELDLKYVREASLLVDLKLIIKTCGVVLKGTGAY